MSVTRCDTPSWWRGDAALMHKDQHGNWASFLVQRQYRSLGYQRGRSSLCREVAQSGTVLRLEQDDVRSQKSFSNSEVHVNSCLQHIGSAGCAERAPVQQLGNMSQAPAYATMPRVTGLCWAAMPAPLPSTTASALVQYLCPSALSKSNDGASKNRCAAIPVCSDS